MSWDYGYQVGPEGGSFTNLSTYCTDVRIPSEFDSPKRGSNVDIPYLDGEFSVGDKYRSAGTYILDCFLAYTNSSGLVTHIDGAAGHVYENLQALKRLIGGRGQHVMVRRNVPHIGLVEGLSENLGGVKAAGPRMRYAFPMRLLDGVWREQAAQTDGVASISSFPSAFTIDTGGDYPIGDATITFTCVAAGDSPSLECTDTGDKISVTGSFATSDVIVVKLGRNPQYTLNGTRYAPISSNRAYWMRLPEATTGLGMSLDATSGTWSVDIDWRNKWL